jgi:hypothetical protein
MYVVCINHQLCENGPAIVEVNRRRQVNDKVMAYIAVGTRTGRNELSTYFPPVECRSHRNMHPAVLLLLRMYFFGVYAAPNKNEYQKQKNYVPGE